MGLKSAIAAATLAASTLACLGAAPAHAESKVFVDSSDQAGHANTIARVRVTYGSRHLYIRIFGGPEDLSSGYQVFLDTAGHGYPEFDVVVSGELNEFRVYRADKWAPKNYHAVCKGRVVYPTVVANVPRWCINRPPRVRVNVKGETYHEVTDTVTTDDYLPSPHYWTPWIRYN